MKIISLTFMELLSISTQMKRKRLCGRLWQNSTVLMVHSILQTLKENGKKVYLLSNAQRSFTYHEMVKLDIVKYFDNIYISSDHGVKKPNPKFFEILLKKEDLDPKDCLFLGNDQECDILGAQGVGMDTWYVHTNCSPEYTEDVKATYEFL